MSSRPLTTLAGAPQEGVAAMAAGLRANAQLFLAMGSPLYAELCARAADDPEVVALALQGVSGHPMALLSAVHALLLDSPGDPLGRYYATLTPDPEPREGAYPEFARFCRQRRDEILALLASHTVQTTYVERCWALAPAMSLVARLAGEPLNLIEIGCSAGVLLTFDQYAYDLGPRGRVGSASAPITLSGMFRGEPELHIPRIGARTGLDLNPIDVRSPDQRRWLLAQCFPDHREGQARLATALDVIAATDIRMLRGDALETLPEALAAAPAPLCVFHSVCLLYWSAEAKAELDRILEEASRDRDIYRLGIEPVEQWNQWQRGELGDAPAAPGGIGQASAEASLVQYSRGARTSRVIARVSADYQGVEWLG